MAKVPDPSTEEIAAACREIRRAWTEREHRLRAAGQLPFNHGGSGRRILPRVEVTSVRFLGEQH